MPKTANSYSNKIRPNKADSSARGKSDIGLASGFVVFGRLIYIYLLFSRAWYTEENRITEGIVLKKVLCCIFVCLLLCTTALAASSVTIEKYGVSFDVPEGMEWVETEDADEYSSGAKKLLEQYSAYGIVVKKASGIIVSQLGSNYADYQYNSLRSRKSYQANKKSSVSQEPTLIHMCSNRLQLNKIDPLPRALCFPVD